MNKLICWIFGHKYYVVQKFTIYSRRVQCHRCNGDWGMHDWLNALVPWDGELAEFHDIIDTDAFMERNIKEITEEET